ncbi:MAG TPA: GNAT family N-acetyltransferase [Candidatus Limnocylindrales bacterium]|nr:GNAT family N-acetyltransferase [Candidatus Limnocylindrales bacterium]
MEDAESCGQVAFQAHTTVAALHNFPSEQPSVEFSVGLVKNKLNDPNVFSALAELNGRVVGSIFLNMFPPTPVAAIGPLTVLPEAQGRVGRALMEAAMQEAARRGYRQVRLVQSPSHVRSLVLYAKLGFDVQEPLVLMQGPLPKPEPAMPGQARPATLLDLQLCNRLCVTTHGFARELELRSGIEQGMAMVVERSGRITGYSSGIGFRGHAVAETNDDLKALIASGKTTPGPGFFVPTRNGVLFRWLLEAGLKVAWPAMLMSFGPYQQPQGVFLNSIAF